MMVWFHRTKIALHLRLITSNYNVIGHHLAQNVRCLLCYQLIKNVSSEHVFYLLLFALYYFCIILKTDFSSESHPGIIGTAYHFCTQYSIYQNFFFLYCQLCKESRSGKLHQFFFHASASVTYVCRCDGMHPSVEQQCSAVTWAALKENLVFNVGFLKAFLVAIANSHNSNVTCWLADVLSTLAFPSELSM